MGNYGQASSQYCMDLTKNPILAFRFTRNFDLRLHATWPGFLENFACVVHLIIKPEIAAFLLL